MILVSAGNTISDYFGNKSISTSGKPQMAFYGTLSAQIFNILIGMGINLFFAEGQKFNLFSSKDQNDKSPQFLKIVFFFS